MDYIVKKCTDCGLNLEYMIAKDDILIFRCFKCKKNCEISFDKKLINNFSSVYYFCKGDATREFNLGDYHDLDVQSDTLLLADIFEHFRDMSLKIYELDTAYFVSLPGFAWHECLKITEVNLELITGINMSLMIESGMSGGACHVMRSYVEANNKYMNNYDESKGSSFLSNFDANNLYGFSMIKKLPVGGFKWVKKCI